LRVAGLQVAVGGLEVPSPPMLPILERRQSPGVLEELGRRLGGPAKERPQASLVELRRDVCVRTGRSQSEMPSPLLDIARQRRQVCMQLAPA